MLSLSLDALSRGFLIILQDVKSQPHHFLALSFGEVVGSGGGGQVKQEEQPERGEDASICMKQFYSKLEGRGRWRQGER